MKSLPSFSPSSSSLSTSSSLPIFTKSTTASHLPSASYAVFPVHLLLVLSAVAYQTTTTTTAAYTSLVSLTPRYWSSPCCSFWKTRTAACNTKERLSWHSRLHTTRSSGQVAAWLQVRDHDEGEINSSDSTSDTDTTVSASSVHEKKDNKDDKSLYEKLDQTFEYDGRMQGATQVTKDYRCGFVCLLGAPNQGKSTIVNALLEETLCATTPRPQTTRHAILGLLTTETCQVCLVDTPGIIESPAYKLQEGMMEAVVSAFHDANVLLVVTDLFSTPIPDDALFRKVQTSKKPKIVCINKVDLADKLKKSSQTSDNAADVNVQESSRPLKGDKTVTVEQAISKWRTELLPDAVAILPMSAGNGPNDPGVVALRRLLTGGPDVPGAIRNLGRPISGMFRDPDTLFLSDEQARMEIPLPISPPLYDPDILTDRPERFIASETIRAALFETLKKELPYCCEVQITKFLEPNSKNNKSSIIRIEAAVIVERDSQKIIVIGKGGEQIKRIGSLARQKLESFFQVQVYLNLSVKVNKDWRKSEEKLKDYGYLR